MFITVSLVPCSPLCLRPSTRYMYNRLMGIRGERLSRSHSEVPPGHSSILSVFYLASVPEVGKLSVFVFVGTGF